MSKRAFEASCFWADLQHKSDFLSLDLIFFFSWAVPKTHVKYKMSPVLFWPYDNTCTLLLSSKNLIALLAICKPGYHND